MKGKTPKVKNMGSPVHIKLDAYEAVVGKKDLLSSEINLLKISQSVSNYKKLRIEELSKKELIRKRMMEIKKNITKIQNLLPILKLPKILQKENPFIEIESENESIEIDLSKSKEIDIESQLKEIQAKLEKLQEY
ncbi:hypothetical protein COU58_01625 [Candidatus Pacearchaeota archaeon CG10_big_fil_rev_8_21_14_0_10_32_42]|nr:MAG: hypothetical protein COU58_01625 [Candidatus Pacearchaeota archaeon CG10_big_fil_rev_8_21_14_0_10_32_42]